MCVTEKRTFKFPISQWRQQPLINYLAIDKGVMNRHIQAAHTLPDQKKYKCDLCGKGFITNNKLSEHMNVHTGEKPHKCKFCSACFASKANTIKHERGHLGLGRKLKK